MPCHSMRQVPVVQAVVRMCFGVNSCVLLDMHDLPRCHAGTGQCCAAPVYVGKCLPQYLKVAMVIKNSACCILL